MKITSILCPDVEKSIKFISLATTGLDIAKGAELVAVSLIQYKPDAVCATHTLVQAVEDTDKLEESFQYHGFSKQYIAECGLSASQFREVLEQELKDSYLFGYNPEFMFQFLDIYGKPFIQDLPLISKFVSSRLSLPEEINNPQMFMAYAKAQVGKPLGLRKLGQSFGVSLPTDATASLQHPVEDNVALLQQVWLQQVAPAEVTWLETHQ